MSFWKHVNIAIKESDIVAEVLDARMPELSRNHEIEKKVISQGKELIFVINKSDLISKKKLESIKRLFGSEKCVFVSGKKNLGMRKLKEFLIILGKRKNIKRPIVCFVGYPNVGKSSVINALVKSAKTSVSSLAGTTKGVQWISTGSLKIIDSPGVIPFDERNEEIFALLGAKNPERLKFPERSAIKIISFLYENNSKLFREYFDYPYLNNYNEILENFAKKRKFLLKGGEIDLRRASLTIIRDWQKGKISESE